MGRPATKTGKIMATLLPLLEPGDYFYIELVPNVVQAYANRLGIKVSAEAMILLEKLSDPQPLPSKLTKVTIL